MSSRAWRLDGSIPKSTSHSTMFFVSFEDWNVGISLKPCSISSAVNDLISPLNNAAVIFSACRNASSP